MARSAPAMWDAAYDYVRLTSKWRDDEDDTPVLYRLAASSLLARHEDNGIPFKPWHWQGYVGKAGPHVSYGSGYNGHIFQASNWAANEARSMVLPWDNAPRVDVAVTVWYEEDRCSDILHHTHISRRFCKGKGGTEWKVTHIDGGEHGTTAYIGSRESDIFIRIYDKWRESGKDEAYKYAIRYEVEYKGKPACEIWAGAHQTAPGREWLAGVVRAQAAARGVFLPELKGAVVAPQVARRTVATDNERRLAWLRNQVGPSVQKLLTDGVDRATILAALGMSLSEPGRRST